MEDWRNEEGSNSSYKSEKVLLSVARQKIWVHWLLWCVPYVNLPGCIISAVLIREWKPIAAGFLYAFIIGILLALSGEDLTNDTTLLLYLGNMGVAGYSHYIILKARDRVDEIRSK